MGNLLQREQQEVFEKRQIKNKLQQVIKISQQQQQKLVHLLKSRGRAKSQYLCTAVNYKVGDPDDFDTSMICQQFKQLTIYYQDFDVYLENLKQAFPLKQYQVQNIIISVCQALLFLIQGPMKTRHGDISPKMICKKGNLWKLIDNSYIRGGISAYQKVLLGQDAFISPFQMDKIRHGFVRQSPAIKQEDDIFSLGMTCLQIMSGRPSKFCYKQTYVRFNEKQIQQRIIKINEIYDQNLVKLVRRMINISEDDRPKIKQVLGHPNIIKYTKKTSLKSNSNINYKQLSSTKQYSTNRQSVNSRLIINNRNSLNSRQLSSLNSRQLSSLNNRQVSSLNENLRGTQNVKRIY